MATGEGSHKSDLPTQRVELFFVVVFFGNLCSKTQYALQKHVIRQKMYNDNKMGTTCGDVPYHTHFNESEDLVCLYVLHTFTSGISNTC